jgi:two-component system, NarL family, nitrate/nitrite response regulator NarL
MTMVESLALSPREEEVLSLLAEGLSTDEMAKKLYIGSSTVKAHIAHLSRKLAGEHERVSRARLVTLGFRAGLLK